eukprot:2581412-Pleurochrysis_carterae.AAC.1
MNLCHPVVRMLVPIIRLTFADPHSSPAAPFLYHAVEHCLAGVERTRYCAGSAVMLSNDRRKAICCVSLRCDYES